MKIALIIQNADRRAGGAESYTLDLARALGRGPGARGHDVTVIAEQGPAAVADGARAAGYQCIYLGAAGRTRWQRLQDFLLRLKDLYANNAYDIVHAMLPAYRADVYQPHSGLAADLLVTGHMKHLRWYRQQFSFLANSLNPKRRGMARIELQMIRHHPHLLCFSSMMRQFAQEHFSLPPDHLVMLMNGIDLARFDPASSQKSRLAIRDEWRVEPADTLGLLVGNNWKLKGLAEAIEALGRLNARPPAQKTLLMVVGHDHPAPYQKLARRWNVADRVLFVGGVSDPRPLYGAADFLLLPTRRDTCSLVVLEALAMGLPVITTRQNGASEVIDNGRQGLLLDRGDAVKLADALRIMADPAQRRAMAKAALAMRDTLSFEHHVSKIEAVYQCVIDERAAGKNVPLRMSHSP